MFIAFIVSAGILWYLEHQKVIEFEDSNTIKLGAKILDVAMSPSDENGNRNVLFFIEIWNGGSAGSLVKDYTGKVSINNRIIDLQFVPIPDTYAGGVTVDNRTFYPMHSIYIRTESALGKNDDRKGVILFTLKDGNNFNVANPKWFLSFSDYSGTRYEIDYSNKTIQIPFIFKKVRYKKKPPTFLLSPTAIFIGSTPK